MRRALHRAAPTLSLALFLCSSGCSDSAKGAHATDGSLGDQVYARTRCETCHGPDGNGLPGIGPALTGIAAHWSRDELIAYLLDPAPFRESKPHLKEKAAGYFAHMRPFPELDEVERGVLADWLLARP